MPLLSPTERADLLDPARNKARAAMMPGIWDIVWWRRIAYFATVAVTAALLSMPLWPAPSGMERLCDDSRCLLPGLFSPLKAVLPGAVAPWVDRYAAQPVTASVLLATLAALIMAGGRLEQAIRARSAAAWACVTRDATPLPGRRGVSRVVRCSAAWLGTLRFIKWRLLPGVAAMTIVVALLAIPAALPVQWWLAHAERDGLLCRDPGTLPTLAEGTPIAFAPNRPCTDLRQEVTPGARYTVTLRMTRQWCDARRPADPAVGVVAGGWRLLPFRFYRRVANANWLKPLLIIRRPDARDGTAPGAKVRIDALDLWPVGGGLYRGQFTAPGHGGRAYLALNDVALPGWPAAFYADNRGAAVVSVERSAAPMCEGDACQFAAPPPPATTCGATIAPSEGRK